MPSMPPFQCFPGGETAPVTPRVEKLEFAESATSFSIPTPHSMSNTSAVPSTLPAYLVPVVAHAHAPDHVPTQIDESDRESAADTQSDDPF